MRAYPITPTAGTHPPGDPAASGLSVPKNFKAPWTMFWAALIVRILYMTLAHCWRIGHSYNDFNFGWEMARIARALDTGYGYADPFHGHTGPTAWVTPLYPLLIAGVFKLSGVYTPLSAWILLALNCVMSALTVRLVWELGARCFDLRVATWSAWIWALYPAAMQYAVKWIWEMTLTNLLFTAVLVLALRMRRIGEAQTGEGSTANAGLTTRRWIFFAVLWALITLSNPALAIFLPVCGVWLLLGAGKQWPRQLGNAVMAGILFAACLAPWTYRNWITFHHFLPMRGNFGAELYLGNGPGATGLLMGYSHPAQDPEQLRLYKQIGEYKYVQMRGAAAAKVIRANVPHFLALTLRRVYFFWISVPHPPDNGLFLEFMRNLNLAFTSVAGMLGLALAIRRRVPASMLFGWAFLLLPLVYYFVTAHARFRHPLEPLIAVTGVYLFQSAGPRTRQDRPALSNH